MLQSNLTQNIRHTVTDCGSGCQGKVYNSKGNPKSRRSLFCHQLTNTRHFKCSLLNRFAKNFKALSTNLLQCSLNNAGTTDTYVDNLICFRYTMECTGHKRIVIRCIAEHHKLCTPQGIIFPGIFRCLPDNLSHQLHGIHIDTGFG